jgi:DNA-binding PadR family transcriptional regulator
MSIRHSLLALLEQEPMYGYQLRAEFEQRTGGAWTLNIGQVYTTLTRLERDELVSSAGADAEGHVHYAITDAGRAEVEAWFGAAVPRETPARDELAIKIALAVSLPGVDAVSILDHQRLATMKALQDYTRLKPTADAQSSVDLAWGLVLDSLIFAAEAELRWLDHCETRVRRATPHVTPTTASTSIEEQAR